MALRFAVFSWLSAVALSSDCSDGVCDAELEVADETTDMNVELLQTAVAVGKRDVQAPGIPYWCYTIDPRTRSTIGSCNGGPGGCICSGPVVCNGWGPFLPGTWQTYSYSCCGCGGMPKAVVPPPTPVASVAPAPVEVAPVAPVDASKAASADCAVHAACASLKLMGSCCPAVDGTMLGCCNSLLETEKVEVNTTNVPAWCASVKKVPGEKIPPCEEAGSPTTCSCVSKSVCGEGAPAPGSWQSFSTACCGCV